MSQPQAQRGRSLRWAAEAGAGHRGWLARQAFLASPHRTARVWQARQALQSARAKWQAGWASPASRKPRKPVRSSPAGPSSPARQARAGSGCWQVFIGQASPRLELGWLVRHVKWLCPPAAEVLVADPAAAAANHTGHTVHKRGKDGGGGVVLRLRGSEILEMVPKLFFWC
eukprot:gene9482-biopygen178